MSRIINQRELRNNSAEIMRALERGEEFIITRNGVRVGELKPIRGQFVSRDALLRTLKAAPHIDAGRFRRDVDEILDQSILPRA